MTTAAALAIYGTACATLAHLWTRARHRAELHRLRLQRAAARIAADEAERELAFERMTNPARIAWGTPAVDAACARLLAEIRSDALLDEIDLRDQR